jgi:hypothetical protein
MQACKFALAVTALASVLLIEGCGKTDKSSAVSANAELISAGGSDVARVCSSQETIDSIREIIFKNVDISNSTPPINSTYKDQLAAGAKVTLDVPTLSSFDQTTKKVSCSAKITFIWPNEIVNRLKSISPSATWSSDTIAGVYDIQPQADGVGLVYSLDGPISNITIGSVMTMLRTLAQDDAAAQERAAAAKASPPPSSPTTGAEDATSHDNNPTDAPTSSQMAPNPPAEQSKTDGNSAGDTATP